MGPSSAYIEKSQRQDRRDSAAATTELSALCLSQMQGLDLVTTLVTGSAEAVLCLTDSTLLKKSTDEVLVTTKATAKLQRGWSGCFVIHLQCEQRVRRQCARHRPNEPWRQYLRAASGTEGDGLQHDTA